MLYTHKHANIHSTHVSSRGGKSVSTLPVSIIKDFDHFYNYKCQRTAKKEISNENARRRTDTWRSLPVRNGMDLEWQIPSIPFYSFM